MALLSLVHYGLLHLRPFSSPAWASDLLREVYGEDREAMVTIPDPASVKCLLQMDELGELGEEETQGKGGGAGAGGAGR